MSTAYVRIRQVTSHGKVLENILETEQGYDTSTAVEFWQGEGYKDVKVTNSHLVECTVINGTIYLPSAVYPNWMKKQYIPTHWNVASIA